MDSGLAAFAAPRNDAAYDFEIQAEPLKLRDGEIENMRVNARRWHPYCPFAPVVSANPIGSSLIRIPHLAVEKCDIAHTSLRWRRWPPAPHRRLWPTPADLRS